MAINLDPSVHSFIHSPTRFHLNLEKTTLCATAENPINHHITSIALNQLKLQALIDPQSASLIQTLHLQIELMLDNTHGSLLLETSLFAHTMPLDLKHKLNEWCDEKIGTPEYVERLKAFALFKDFFEAKKPHLELYGVDITSLPDLTNNDLPAIESFFIGDCPYLTAFPKLTGHFRNLKEIIVTQTSIETFPDLDGDLFPLLERIHIIYCPKLVKLNLINKFLNLTTLALLNLRSITAPMTLSSLNFPKLQTLFACDCPFSKVFTGCFSWKVFNIEDSDSETPSYVHLTPHLPMLLERDEET